MKRILELQNQYQTDCLQYENEIVDQKYGDLLDSKSIYENQIKVYQGIIEFLERYFSTNPGSPLQKILD